MPRLFIPPDWIEIDKVTFPPEYARHLTALGFQKGDQLTVLDDTGWEHEIVLVEVSDGTAVAQVAKKTLAPGERRTKITLYQGLVSPDDFEEILCRGTELGLVEFVPITCDRCDVPEIETFDESMLEAWRKRISTVAEAAKRGRRPRLRATVLFDTALDQAVHSGTALMIWEGEDSQDIQMVIKETPFSVHLFAPPPAGFSSDEVDRACQLGALPVRPPLESTEEIFVGLLTSQAILDELG